MKKKLLGVIGGVGPAATVRFANFIVEKTKVERDQDHIDMLIYNHATIPDRSAYILGKSEESPLPVIIEDAKMLERCGADYITLLCNTAHTFFDDIKSSVKVPVLNIVDITADYLVKQGFDKCCVLSTLGTYHSKVYQNALAKRGIECISPDEKGQETVMDVIYNHVKAGNPGGGEKINKLLTQSHFDGCKAIVLACTELSLLTEEFNKGLEYIDSLELLADKCIDLFKNGEK